MPRCDYRQLCDHTNSFAYPHRLDILLNNEVTNSSPENIPFVLFCLSLGVKRLSLFDSSQCQTIRTDLEALYMPMSTCRHHSLANSWYHSKCSWRSFIWFSLTNLRHLWCRWRGQAFPASPLLLWWNLEHRQAQLHCCPWLQRRVLSLLLLIYGWD